MSGPSGLVALQRLGPEPGRPPHPHSGQRTKFCANGCGYPAARGLDRFGVPFETCCRGCALGLAHDAGCASGGDKGSYQDAEGSTAVGIVLGTMVGDVLGACVEGWAEEQIKQRFPRGLRSFQQSPRGFGRYTDDSQMTIALVHSLLEQQRCDPENSARWYSTLHEQWRGYGQFTDGVLQGLADGKLNYRTSGRAFREDGSHGNGGAMRIAPVGFVYRYCDLPTLKDAVRNALLCTHVHPVAIDGAYVQAAATAELSKYRIRSEGGDRSKDLTPPILLTLLKGVAETQEMLEKLDILLEGIQTWEAQGASTQYCRSVRAKVSESFQIKGTEAVACALWAMCTHWDDPSGAVIAAVAYGGDTDTVAALAGALAGARHGWEWIPVGWYNKLENANYGRNSTMASAAKLALIPTPPPV